MANKISKLCFVGLALLLCFGQGCIKHQELINLRYEEGTDSLMSNSYHLNEEYRIRPFDNLFIRVNSFEGNTISYFNNEAPGSSSNNANRFTEAAVYFNSYVVSQAGEIVLPVIGSVFVEGMTVNQIKDTLDKKLGSQLKRPSTTVKFANFRITVLGEVYRPGTMYIYNDKVNLLQAIGQAGDFTNYANRKRIKLVRDTDQGAESVYLDITDPDILESEYFFMRPNDVLYVEPLKARAFDLNFRAAGIVISVASVTTLVANLILTNINRQ